MNAKEMEALIIAQGRDIAAAQEAHMHLVQRTDNIVEGFKKELAARDEFIAALTASNESQVILNQGYEQVIAFQGEKIVQLTTANDEAWVMAKQRLSAVEEQLTAVHEQMSEMRDQQDGMNDTLFGSVGRIEKLETLVLARNASAATKRNMTDEDALRVLTGDLRETSHKEAAEKIGLTYAQVYSCRLEFTFKHVHKDLRDNVKGWKNVWAK